MKMMKRKTGYALFAAVVLLMCSNESLSAAQQAAYGFWKRFLPAMLPFFLLSPYLTSPEAQAAFGRVFGRMLERAFRIPGGAAGAVLCAFAAGTPAGSMACADAGRDAENGAYARLCFLCSGLSPAFLITAVGDGYLGDPRAGWTLYLSHIGALILGAFLLRRAEPKWDRQWSGADRTARGDIFTNALLATGKVLCWMVIFGIASRILADRLERFVPGWLIAGLCEISAGAEEIMGAQLSGEARMLILSACTGFGGLCVIMQCAGATGIPLRCLLPVKALHALLSTGITYLLLQAGVLPDLAVLQDIFGLSTAAAIGCTAVTGALIAHARRLEHGAGGHESGGSGK